MRRFVFIGFACNNRCIVCAQGDLRASLGLRPEAEIAAEIAAAAPGDVVALVGGEPTLARGLPEWITAADAARARRVLVQTNARRLSYAAYARELAARSKRLALDVSLLGSTVAMHDHHTRAPGSFRETARGIRHARAAGIPVAITVVVTRANYRHLAEIAALAAALGADAIRFASLELVGTAKSLEKSLAPHAELVLPHLARARTAAAQRRLRVALEPLADEDDRFAGLGVTALEEPRPRTLPLSDSPSQPSPPLRR